MKQIIKDVLDDMSNSQVNLGSSAARKMVSTLISTALESKGCYTEYGDDEIEEQKARATWVCSICGENTFDVDYDYIGSGTNHLGCEMKNWDEIKEHINENDDSDSYTGPEPRVVDDAGVDIETGKYTGPYREKNWLQKKHEDKVFGHDLGGPYEYKKEDIQKQLYTEMTSDGLPEGGDARAVLESHKLADEIVDRQEGKWIYESPDGGKTVFRRPFADYDSSKKEHIDWETKEPTGKTFIDYPWSTKGEE
jgi:hypothetical protein